MSNPITYIPFSLNNNQEQINKNSNLDKQLSKAHECPILSILIEDKKDNRKNSLKTANTNIYTLFKLDYDFKEIKKYDELNNSLSAISEFDLEKDKEDISDFNSSQENNSEFEEEIIIKRKTLTDNRTNDLEFEIELEKEYKEIIKKLI